MKDPFTQGNKKTRKDVKRFSLTKTFDKGLYASLGSEAFAPNEGERYSVIPQGPKAYQASADKDDTPIVRFCRENNARFAGGGSTSLPECYIYFVLDIILGPEKTGGWSYQEGETADGRHTVVDFVIYEFPTEIGIRVQGFYFHAEQGSNVSADDLDQYSGLSEQMDVYDVWDNTFVYDKSGAATFKVVSDILNGVRQDNPRATGIVGISTP